MATNNFSFQEENTPKRLNVGVWQKIGAYALKSWPLLIALLLLMMITSFYDSSFIPSLTKATIDVINNNATSSSTDITSVVFDIKLIFGITFQANFTQYVLLFIVGILVRSLSIFITFFITNYLSMKIMNSLRRDAFIKIQELPFSYFDRTPSGWLIARMQNDTADIGDILSWGLVTAIWALFDIVFTVITMFSFDWRLSLVIICSLPILIIIVPLFQKWILKEHRIARNAYSNYVRWLAECIDGAKTIKTLGIENEVYKESEEVIQDIRKKRFKAHRINAYFQPIVSLLSSVTVAAIILVGIGMVNANPTDISLISTIVLFVGFVAQIFNPIQNLSEIFSEFISTQASAEKVISLLNKKADIIDTPDVIEKYGTIFSNKTANFEPLKGDIIFKDVSFAYANNVEVIHNMNITIKEGTSVALVGETGGGKTTTVNLLCRFYEPTSGEILINGEDYRKHSLSWLHSNIGYVQQTPFVFTSTYKDNIRYGKLNASDEEIIAAAKMVGIHDFIAAQKDGYNTKLSDGGGSLSQGQKQLISFARAILRNPKILILDEATSSVDTETEAKIQSVTNRILSGRTSIIIAHRLSTIVNSDRIVLIRNGLIVEDGTHKELMALNGQYHDMYMRQFKDLDLQEQISTYESELKQGS
ncbi:MAG: ABC transporter ATP-binding protein [Bacilli bacterium]|jgi:ATP-binding cassette subfamily B protein